MAAESGNPKDRLGMLKPDLALLPPAGSIEQARAQQDGARKYGAYNWRLNNVRAMIYISAAMRHLMCYLDGEEYSRDSCYIVLNDDPRREWLQVLQVGIWDPEHDEIMVWPTPESLNNALYVTAMTKEGYTLAEAVHPSKYTIVQMPVHHLGHFMACAAIVLDARANGALIDDRPSKGAANDLIADYTLQKPPPVPEPFSPEGTDATWHEEAVQATERRKREQVQAVLERRIFDGGQTASEVAGPDTIESQSERAAYVAEIRRTSEMTWPDNVDAGSGP